MPNRDEIIDELDLLVDLDERHLLEQILRRLVRLDHSQERMMSVLSDLQAADEALRAEVDAVLAEVTDLESKVNDLTGQVAAGVSPADLQPVIDDINSQAARIKDALTPAPVDGGEAAVVDGNAESPV